MAAVAALGEPDRPLGADDLEVAVLERGNGRRAFRRIDRAELARAARAAPPTRRQPRKRQGGSPGIDPAGAEGQEG